MAIIAGIVIDHCQKRWIQLLGMIVGTAICYAPRTAWFCMQADTRYLPRLPYACSRLFLLT